MYLHLRDLCGEQASKEYVKCLAGIVGLDIFLLSVSELTKLIPKIGKVLGKTIHWGALYYAIFEFYECNKDLAMTCEY